MADHTTSGIAVSDVALAGAWTYRSFVNSTDLVNGDATAAVNLIFGEGIFTFATPSSTELIGIVDFGGGYVLDLRGTVTPAGASAPLTVAIVGTGRDNTPTKGWEYDYHAFLGFLWPNGVNQVPSLVGTVVRAKPHGASPAGYVASFIAVKSTGV